MIELNGFFLKDMMLKLGFAQNWVELIMRGMCTVKYKVRVNGSFTEEIIPERWLRQGDPLSLLS